MRFSLLPLLVVLFATPTHLSGCGEDDPLLLAPPPSYTDLDPAAIVEKSLAIAADICVYTNHHRTIEVLDLS